MNLSPHVLRHIYCVWCKGDEYEKLDWTEKRGSEVMNPLRIRLSSIEVLKNKSDAYNCENQNEKAYSVIFSDGIPPHSLHI